MERASGFVVALDRDLDEEQARALAEAIRCLRGVASVETVPVDPGAFIVRQRLYSELRDKIGAALSDACWGTR